MFSYGGSQIAGNIIIIIVQDSQNFISVVHHGQQIRTTNIVHCGPICVRTY